MKIKMYKHPKDQDRRLNNWSANTYTVDSEFSEKVKYVVKNDKFIILTDSCEIVHEICNMQNESKLYIKEIEDEINSILSDVNYLKKIGVRIGAPKK